MASTLFGGGSPTDKTPSIDTISNVLKLCSVDNDVGFDPQEHEVRDGAAKKKSTSRACRSGVKMRWLKSSFAVFQSQKQEVFI